MFVLFVLLTLVGVGQVISQGDIQPQLQSNSLESKAIQHILKENPELSDIDPKLYESKTTSGSSKSLISDIVIGVLLRELTRTSNFPTLVATNISEKCHNDSQDYFTAHLLLTNWATKMFESTGKLPEGLFGSGNLHANGLFEECIRVQADWTNTSFQGKYCTVYLDSELVMPWELAEETEQIPEDRTNVLSIFESLVWLYNGPTLKQPKVRDTDIYSKYLSSIDFCIPSSCTMEDFRSAVAELIGSRAIDNVTYNGESFYTAMVSITDERHCYTKESLAATPKFNGADIAVIVTLSILGFVILLATVHEFWLQYNNRPLQLHKSGFGLKALHSFSMLSNSRKLLSTKSTAVDNLSCLNGIRVLSTTWIVLYHTYYVAIINPVTDVFLMIEDAMTWQVHAVLNATIAVDTFFLMSALLVTYSLMRELDRNKGRFNVGLFYLHRYLRLTPVYAVILGFIATLLAYLGAGPYWQNIQDLSMVCRYNWWNNLLYINNYVLTYPSECMGETWYLACDMQMFIFSPLLIYPLWKWWKIGLAWTTFNIVSMISGTIAIYIAWDLPAMGFFTRDTSNPHYYYGYYVQLWTRFPPYILGIILGWLLHISKKQKIEMSKIIVTVGWTLSIVIGLAVVYGMVPFLNPSEEMSDFVRVSYGSLHRLTWAACVAWVIFACIHGYGGYVNNFLSWKIFIPLGRLTYVVYLIHLNYLTVFHAFTRQPYYYTKFNHTEHYFGTILMVFFMAFVICLTVEVPFLNLERLILPSRTKNPSVNVKNDPSLPESHPNAETASIDVDKEFKTTI